MVIIGITTSTEQHQLFGNKINGLNSQKNSIESKYTSKKEIFTMEDEKIFSKNDEIYQVLEDKTLVKLSMKNNIVYYETQFSDNTLIGVFYKLIKDNQNSIYIHNDDRELFIRFIEFVSKELNKFEKSKRDIIKEYFRNNVDIVFTGDFNTIFDYIKNLQMTINP